MESLTTQQLKDLIKQTGRPKVPALELTQLLDRWPPQRAGKAFIAVLDNTFFIKEGELKLFNVSKPPMYILSEDKESWVKNPQYDKYMEVMCDDE